jgi:hypothetical protein
MLINRQEVLMNLAKYDASVGAGILRLHSLISRSMLWVVIDSALNFAIVAVPHFRTVFYQHNLSCNRHQQLQPPITATICPIKVLVSASSRHHEHTAIESIPAAMET